GDVSRERDGVLLVFFFFQAEDGIRAFHVTGVQTCALPICTSKKSRSFHSAAATRQARAMPAPAAARSNARTARSARAAWAATARSEERRVGKERGPPRPPGEGTKAGDARAYADRAQPTTHS